MKLTPEQLAHKKQRDALQALRNRVESGYNFKTVRTWGDVYKFVSQNSFTTPPQQAITYQEIGKLFDELLKQLIARQTAQATEPEVAQPTVSTTVHTLNGGQNIQSLPKSSAIFEPELEGTDDKSKPSIDNDYLLPVCKREHKDLIKYWFQRKAAKECLEGIVRFDKKGQQVVAAAGYGKTFIAGAVAARLADMNFCEGKSYGSTTMLYVTKNSVVQQTKRVFEKMFNLGIKDGFEVINYEALRSKAGKLWVKEEVHIEGGEEVIKWKWRKFMNPVVIFWDENQSLKNSTSLQHQIACQFNEIETPTYQVFISATPFMRVSEAKCFAVSTRKDITLLMGVPTVLSNSTWPTYASVMAGSQSTPEEYNEAAVERLTKDLEPYFVRVRGVRPQFRAINKVELIQFDTIEERKYYDDTEERYLREKAKLQQDIDAGLLVGGGIHHLVLLTKRAVAAEQCRVRQFAKRMIQWERDGFAAACAVKYKTTLIPLVKILHEEYGIPRDKISLVWGGGQTQLTKKQKAKAQISAKAEQLTQLGLSKEEILKSLDLEDVEDRILEELPAHLRLGSQSLDERQREIDRFQSGKALFCIYTFKAGGVGLSLHHTDEQTIQKVRRLKSGYAVVEDIPSIPTRPRKTALSVAYSGIDMVQSIGRVPRLTSLSDTEQVCLLYDHTVEVDIAHIYSSKLRCLNKVVRNNESWLDIILHGDRKAMVQELTKNDTDDGEEVSIDTED